MRFITSALLACFFLQPLSAQEAKIKPLKGLLVLGGCCHDYVTQQELLKKGIEKRTHIEITVAYDPDKGTKHLNPIYESADWAKGYDVIIHDECSSDVKDVAVIDRILDPHRAGLPAVILHCGMHSYRSEGYPEKVTPWFEFTGLQSTGHGKQLPIAIEYVQGASPILNGLSNWTTINEELYNNSSGKLLDTATALARGKQTSKNKQGEEKVDDFAIIWTNTYRPKDQSLCDNSRPQQRHGQR